MFDPVADNQVRHQPGSRVGHVESYFLKLNDPSSPKALWLKFTILSPNHQPQEASADLWAIAFDGELGHAAIKRSWRLLDSEAQMGFYPLRLGESTLGPDHTRGAIEKAGHRIEWDLRFTPTCPPMHLFPYELMYRLPLPRSKTLTPYPDARFEGSYWVDGREIPVRGWSGTQGHNWGKEHAFRYAWSHCNLLRDEQGVLQEDSYFEGLSGVLKIGSLTTPPLSSVWLRLRGVDLPFTLKDVSWGGADVSLEARDPYRWTFSLEGEAGLLKGEAEATREQMVGLYYPNPDGAMTYCLNSRIAKLRLSLHSRKGSALVLSSDAAALELGTRDPDHGVTMAI